MRATRLRVGNRSRTGTVLASPRAGLSLLCGPRPRTPDFIGSLPRERLPFGKHATRTVCTTRPEPRYWLLALKARRHISPGHRPGSTRRRFPALKARHKSCIANTLYRPFRALACCVACTQGVALGWYMLALQANPIERRPPKTGTEHKTGSDERASDVR